MNKKLILYIVLLLGGISLGIIGEFVFIADNMKAISGIFIGIGAGLFGMSIAQIVNIRILTKHPEYKRKATIDEKDERNITIRNKSKAKGFDAMGIIFGVLILIYALINANMVFILLLVGAYLLVYTVQLYYLQKYSKEM